MKRVFRIRFLALVIVIVLAISAMPVASAAEVEMVAQPMTAEAGEVLIQSADIQEEDNVPTGGSGGIRRGIFHPGHGQRRVCQLGCGRPLLWTPW